MRVLGRSGCFLLVLVMLVAVSGCEWPGGTNACGSDSGSEPTPTPTCDTGAPANADLKLNVINPIVTTGSPYQIQVTWAMTMVQAGSTPGPLDSLTFQKTYSGTVGLEDTSPDSHGYQVSYQVGQLLSPGQVRFTVTTDLENWTTSCTQNFPPGSLLSVNFTHGKDGCTIGTQFP
jgi:hypothetical protein